MYIWPFYISIFVLSLYVHYVADLYIYTVPMIVRGLSQYCQRSHATCLLYGAVDLVTATL